MKKLITLPIAALLFCYAQLVNAQVTIEAQSADACKFSTLSIDISATDFENMVSAQFAVFWDETILDYDGVTAYAPFSYPTHFEESFVGNGELRFIWFDPTFPPGQTVPDGNPIFTINFNVIGDYGMMSNISFGPSPPFFIVDLQSTSGSVALNPIDGQVTVDNEDPAISGCPPGLVNVIAPFDSTTTYSYDWTAPVASDNCGLVSFDSSHTSGAQQFPVGMTTAVTYVATDSAGNSATCMFNVNVLAGANPNALTFSVESDIDSMVLDTSFLLCGAPFTIALTVQNFDDILSNQFGVGWDETVIQLDSYTDIINASHPTATYIDNYSSEGQFRYGWIDSGLDGEDIPDGDTLFLLHFSVLNPLAGPTAINIEGFPFEPGPPIIPPFPLEAESATTGTIPNNTINFNGMNLVLVPNQAPVLAFCNDREVIADADCSVPLPDYRNLVSATDDCTDSTSLILTQMPVVGTAVTADVMVSIVAEDAEGLKDTCTFLVELVDNTDPVPTLANLPNATGQCSATVTAPTATDNCAGAITGTTSDPLTYNTQGTFTITWTYNDGNGNTATQTQTVIVDDTTNPVPNVANLPNATGECAATVTAPTATDNCAGAITATTANPITYNTQGTFVVTWTYNDGNGNTVTQTQTVIVDDVTAPVPDMASLPNATGECAASVTAPTATDNCEGAIVGTTTDPTSYNTQGTFTITWTYDDGNGNISMQTQLVVVDDVTAPVPDVANLPVINIDCSVTLTAPTATDNCVGAVTATTTDPTTYSSSGTYMVTWTYNDGNGNTSTQTQTVIVNDATAPVPDVASLPNATGECSVTVSAPTATDNCEGAIVGTTTDPTSYNAQGTFTITWTYDDGNGNISTQTQTVVVDDVTAPVPDVANLPVVNIDCSATLTAPTATDNCAGAVTATTTDPTTYGMTGTYMVTWTYNDGNGNTATQTQTVIVDDVTAPVPDMASLPNATGECAASVTAPTATDNCEGAIVGTTTDPTSYNTQGTFTITWTYDDGNGNISMQTQLVVVDDVTAPVPDVANLPAATNDCGVTLTAPTATDNCAGTVTATTTDPTTYNTTGTYMVTWTYDDGNGNTSSQTQTVVISDMTAPVPTVANLPDATGDCSVTVSAPTATDNCAGTVTATTSDPLTYNTQGTFTITWTYDDGNGNLATQTQTVIVDDVTAPVPNVANLPTITGQCSATVVAAPTATDNCAGTVTATTSDPLTYNTQGTFTITWTYNDGNGNISTQTQTVIVDDVTAPVPNVANLPIVTDQCSVTLIVPSATDNCEGAILGTTTDPMMYNTQGTFMVTWTYDDGNGNVAMQTQTVIVDDMTAPVPNVANLPTAAVQCGATVSPPSATDNCAGTVTATTTDPTIFNTLGTFTITWVYNDGNGNTSTQSQTVEVEDTQAPVFTNCPGNINQPVDTGTCDAVVTWAMPTATDNCDSNPSIACTPTAGSVFPVGTTTVICTAMDAEGNQSTCQFDVTIFENQDPTITCPPNQVENLDANCDAVLDNYISLGTYSDNCTSLQNLNIVQFPDSGTVITALTIVSLIVTDEAGNNQTCNFEVSVGSDLTPPGITCPANQSVIANADCESTLGKYFNLATVNDNCSLPANITVTQDPTMGTVINSNTVVTLAAEDEAGNTSFCTLLVTLSDTIAPSITCPADITQTTDPGICGAVITWGTPTATDNCDNSPVITCSHVSGASFPVGTTMVICIAEDDAGNQDTCSFSVTVDDNEDPTLTCQSDTVIIVPMGTTDTLISGLGLTDFDDNCGIDTIFYVLTGATTGTGSGSTVTSINFNLDTTLVTFIIIDDSGNSDTCSFEVIIELEIPIEIDCPANLAFNNTPSQCNTAVFGGLTPTIMPINILDNYGYVLTGATTGSGSSSANGETFNVGTTTVTYTAVSIFGDTAICSFTVQVNDTEVPVFSNCPNGPQTVNNATGQCGTSFIGNLVPLATDNCPGLTINYSTPLGGLIPVGTNTITATAQDASGITTICAYTLIVNDTEAPLISGCSTLINNPIIVDAAPGLCSAIVSWVEPTATDNCTLIAFTPSQGPGTSFNVGITPVEYVAVDVVGNVSKCQFNVTVVDNQAPIFTGCPGNITVNNTPGECSAVVTWPQILINDNCGVVAFSCTDVSGTTFPVGIHQVSCSAVDAAGNTTVCSFNVTVVDNELPNIFNMPADVTVDADPDQCGATVTWQDPLAGDNCAIEDFTSTFAPGDTFPVGQTDVQYVAIDENGNVRILEFTITVEDNSLPVFSCPGDITLTAAGELVSGSAGFITNFVSIDCEKIELEFDTPATSDNCGPITVTQTEGPLSGQIFGVGANTVTFLATDANNNPSTCSFEITVQSVDNAVAGAFSDTPCEGDDVFFFVNEYPNATYTWTNPAGDTISDQPFFFYPSLEVGESGTYKVVVDLPFNCSRQALVDITVVPNPNPGITYNDLLCTDGSMPLNLMAVDSANAGVTDWIWELPDGSFVFGQNITINNATSADSGPYTVTAVNANGCAGFATVNVSILDEPMMPTLFGTASSACIGDEIVLNGQQLNGTSVEYIWTADPMAGSGLIAINNNVLSVNPTAPGIYHYYYLVLVDGCYSDTAEWVINVEAPPALSIVVDGQVICVDGMSSITLTDTVGDATQWTWSGPCIAGTVTGSSVELQNVNADCSGTYTVVGTTNNGCVNQQSVQLTITNQPPNATLAASETSICTGNDVLLVANPNYGQTAQYIWSGENLPPNASSVQSFEVTLETAGLYTYTFAAVVNGCSTNVDTVEILVEDAPPVNVTVTGDVACVDGTGSVTLHSNATDAVSWIWTNAAGTTLSLDSVLVLNNVTAAQSGSYFVEANSAIGCTSFGFYELTITSELPPVEATLEQTACEDGDLVFSATFIPGAAYEWRNPANGIFSTDPNPTIFGATADQNGAYTVTVALNGCTSSDDTLVTVLIAPIAKDEPVVGEVNTPQSFNVAVNDILASNNYTITILDQTNNGNVVIDNNSPGVLTYTPNNGFRETDMMAYQICYDECPDLCDVALVTLYIRFPGDTCVITSVITPNNDGINDEFVVSCLEPPYEKLQNDLYIFNQWGDKVYEATPYKNDWRGTWSGKDLPDGTYFYIFKSEPGAEPQKGFVMIYR